MGTLSRPVRWLIVASSVWTLAVPLAAWWFDVFERMTRGYNNGTLAWAVWAYPLVLAWFGYFVWRRLTPKK